MYRTLCSGALCIHCLALEHLQRADAAPTNFASEGQVVVVHRQLVGKSWYYVNDEFVSVEGEWRQAYT